MDIQAYLLDKFLSLLPAKFVNKLSTMALVRSVKNFLLNTLSSKFFPVLAVFIM